MQQVQINANDLIDSYRNRCSALMEECAMQAALIAELQRQKEVLAAELAKKNAPEPQAPQ